MYSVTLWFPL